MSLPHQPEICRTSTGPAICVNIKPLSTVFTLDKQLSNGVHTELTPDIAQEEGQVERDLQNASGDRGQRCFRTNIA